ARGDWNVGKMVNVEELPPIPFLALLDEMGLQTRIRDAEGDRPLAFGTDRPTLPAARRA
ncbi:MAG: saccharopine dehydrogenase, partial [Parvibaculaceae bacterium]